MVCFHEPVNLQFTHITVQTSFLTSLSMSPNLWHLCQFWRNSFKAFLRFSIWKNKMNDCEFTRKLTKNEFHLLWCEWKWRQVKWKGKSKTTTKKSYSFAWVGHKQMLCLAFLSDWFHFLCFAVVRLWTKQGTFLSLASVLLNYHVKY